MQIKSYANLNEMMRKAPLNAETVKQFRNEALLAVDQAIDIFFKPEREVSEGKEAYNKLSDVERALRSYQGRFKAESEATKHKFQAIAEQCKGFENFRGDVGKTASILPEGKPLEDGYRVVEAESRVKYGKLSNISEDQNHITQVVQQMSQVLPLYGSVAMVPGPLSVSLKDHIKESLQWSIKSESQSYRNMQEEAYRLLTLSHSKETTVSSSFSSSESSGKQETITTDERVIPELHGIREALSSLDYAPEEMGTFSRNAWVEEFEKVPTTHGTLWWKEEGISHETVNRGNLSNKGSATAIPGRIHMFGAPNNEGLTRPGAGADLVDLVADATLDQDFVDSFRERALQVLDKATETLFNTQREVSLGRESYDELSNLQRALTLANHRFGAVHGYSANPLEEEISKLDSLAPLYACVAMVPGEMSSSVKQHAKELFEASIAASSGSVKRSKKEHLSLLGSLKEGSDDSSESSSTTGYVRKESQTTDERIMPLLHELRMSVDQMAIEQTHKGEKYLTITRIERM